MGKMQKRDKADPGNFSELSDTETESHQVYEAQGSLYKEEPQGVAKKLCRKSTTWT